MKSKYILTVLFSFFIFKVYSQNEQKMFWALNNTPPTLIWDMIPSNSQINNSNGTWDFITPNWVNFYADNTVNKNIVWQNCAHALFGGNTGVSSAGTVTLSPEYTITSPLILRSIKFMPATSGNFTIAGQYITSCNNFQLPIYANTSLSPTISSVLQGSMAISKEGSGTLNLTGVNTYTKNTNVNSGTLNVPGTGVIGTGELNINNSSVATFTSTALQTIAGLTGNGTLNATNANFLLLIPSTSVFGGTANINNSIINHGSSSFGGSQTWNGNINISGNVYFRGQIGPSGITVSDYINGAITGTGVLNVGASGGANSAYTNQYNVYLNNTANTFSGGLILRGSNLGYIGGTYGTVYANSVGTGNVTIEGNWGKDWHLVLTAPNAIASTATLSIHSYSGAYFGWASLNGFNQQIAALSSGSGATSAIVDNGSATNCTLTLGGTNSTFSFYGIIRNGGSGKLNIVKNGTGTFNIGGGIANSYSGTTTINGGVINCNKVNGLGTGDVTINNLLSTLSLGANIPNNITLNLGTILIKNGFTTGTVTNNGGVILP